MIMVRKLLQEFLQGHWYKVARRKKAANSAIRMLQQHNHFLSNWKQPEQWSKQEQDNWRDNKQQNRTRSRIYKYNYY